MVTIEPIVLSNVSGVEYLKSRSIATTNIVSCRGFNQKLGPKSLLGFHDLVHYMLYVLRIAWRV